MKDPYQGLGVARTDDSDTIRKAFKKLARKYHPDVNKDPGAEERFKEINTAYAIVGDDEKRKQWDAYGEASTRQGFDPNHFRSGGFDPRSGMDGGVDMDDFLSSLFGGARTGGGPRRSQRGVDQKATLTVDFLDTVRGADGNNSVRHLVVPGYNTNIEHTASGFVAPVDPTENHLILSAHYYDPYSFALEASTQTWGAGAQGADDWGQEAHVTAQLDLLKSTATAQGLPAILGEYGAVHQSGFEEYRRYYLEYVTKAAKLRGIVPFYWDNGAQTSGADGFGLFNRTTGAVTRPTIVDAMLRAASGNGTLLEIPPAAP